MKVPNLFPKTQGDYRIALIGEAPGADEEVQGQPFVGMSGRFLSALMSRASISREAVFLGNICQDRPPGNDIKLFAWDSEPMVKGRNQLQDDLSRFQPNLVVLLGNTPLRAALGPGNSIANWRGSLFECNDPSSPFYLYKCLPTYHPAYCLRDYSTTPLLQLDLHRATSEGRSPRLCLPERNLQINLSYHETIEKLQDILDNLRPISLDIEGGIASMSCLSVATSKTDCFIIPFSGGKEGSFWTEEEEINVWRKLDAVLVEPRISKVLQNSLYDRFVLAFSYGVNIEGVRDDTMLKWWELYCELEKSLGVQASILTREPFYKAERKAIDNETFWRYCCKDSAVTFEINENLERRLNGSSLAHYKFNVSLLEPLLYMELRGIAYDSAKAKDRREKIVQTLYELQAELDEITNHKLPSENLLPFIAEKICFKRQAHLVKTPNDILLFCKKAYYDKIYPLIPCLDKPLTQAQMGQLGLVLKTSLNPDSTTFTTFLFDVLRLPPQYKKRADGRTSLTADYEALLKSLKSLPSSDSRAKVLDLAIQIRALATNAEMLEIKADKDGRIRCGYNIVGTETGRLSCYTSPTGSGYNLQTIPGKDRDLFTTDDDSFWLFQCDLSGADGWTVAAHLANLGDRTMLDDYLFGLKPAKVLCLMLRKGASVSSRTRPELKELSKEVKKEDWDYFACKIGQHGSSYLMGAMKLSNQLFIQSEGKVKLSKTQAEDLQRLFFLRYNVKLWHNYTQRLLNVKPVITSASGHKRVFFGRKDEILGNALAHEPQANTTYATNLAAWRLWSDHENRMSSMSSKDDQSVPQLHVSSDRLPNIREEGTGLPREDNRGEIVSRSGIHQHLQHRTSRIHLRIEPLHQVHDALVGQFKKSDTAWAISKIRGYFNNPLIIAGQSITIPFEGSYGDSWGNLTEGVI